MLSLKHTNQGHDKSNLQEHNQLRRNAHMYMKLVTKRENSG